MSTNANDIEYVRATLLGQEVLLSEERIDKTTVPKGLYCYDIRHSDYSWNSPVTIENYVLVNWYGSILCKAPIELDINPENGRDAYRRISGRNIRRLESGISLKDWFQPNQLRVLLVTPMERPREVRIGSDLKSLQTAVGGDIEIVHPFPNDSVAVVCNESGKLLGLPPNRLLKDQSGEPYDALCGTFFVAGIGEEDFCSLTDGQVKRYTDYYSREMLFPAPKAQKSDKALSAGKKKPKSHER